VYVGWRHPTGFFVYLQQSLSPHVSNDIEIDLSLGEIPSISPRMIINYAWLKSDGFSEKWTITIALA